MVLFTTQDHFFEVQFSLKAWDGWYLSNDKKIYGFGYYKSFEPVSEKTKDVNTVKRSLALPCVSFRLITIKD